MFAHQSEQTATIQVLTNHRDLPEIACPIRQTLFHEGQAACERCFPVRKPRTSSRSSSGATSYEALDGTG